MLRPSHPPPCRVHGQHRLNRGAAPSDQGKSERTALTHTLPSPSLFRVLPRTARSRRPALLARRPAGPGAPPLQRLGEGRRARAAAACSFSASFLLWRRRRRRRQEEAFEHEDRKRRSSSLPARRLDAVGAPQRRLGCTEQTGTVDERGADFSILRQRLLRSWLGPLLRGMHHVGLARVRASDGAARGSLQPRACRRGDDRRGRRTAWVALATRRRAGGGGGGGRGHCDVTVSEPRSRWVAPACSKAGFT